MSTDGPLGAVLCGGGSRRMGQDKALLRLDRVPMAERVALALEAGGCAEVVMIGGDEAGLRAAIGRRWAPDRWPGEGPLGGLITALEAAEGRGAVVSACDLPDLDGPTVRALLDAADAAPSDVDAVVAATEHPHLLAWWRPGAQARLTELFVAGERGIRRAQRRVRVIEVAVEPHTMRNVNEPADLAPGE
ncbi:MAG: molybdenum cofactor guanylyltransferase [Desertimonas sp.]